MSPETTAIEFARLPGLDEVPVSVQPSGGHYIERPGGKRLMVFAGRSHPELAQKIAEHIGVELGGIELDSFANDETYVRFDESIRGADVFLVQTGCPPIDRNLMELCFMIQAAKLASAKRITAVIPLYPYARQDRKAKPREPISARFVADLLQLAGADRVLTMDLHAGQIQGFFTVPVDHMTALPLFGRHFRDLGFTGVGVVSVAADAGRARVALRFAEMLDAEFAVLHKTRLAHEAVAVSPDGRSAQGLSNQTSFLRPIVQGTIHATARRRHRGRTTWVWEVDITDDEGRVCALVRMTVAVRQP